MAWTEVTRQKYRRDGLRYASDTTDDEWAVIELRLPAPLSRGRPREVSLREIVNAIFYIAQTCRQKRHLLTDTAGNLVGAVVHTADIQDRDRAPAVFEKIRYTQPWLRHVFADAAYAGQKLDAALTHLGKWTIEIIRRCDTAQGFQLLLRRWVVERTIAWLNLNRRLAKDFEASIESALAWVMIASVKLLSRRLARG